MLIESLAVGPLQTNCYLIGKPPRVAVVDPGAESDRILSRIDALGLQVEAVLLTHGHIDHIAHVAYVVARWPVPVALHPADLPLVLTRQWEELELFLGAAPCPKPSWWLEDGQKLQVAGLELSVLHTPGHTPGSVCLLEDSSRQALVGDTLFYRGVGRTDFPGGDWETLERSIREKLYRLDGDWVLYPGHGPRTSLEEERWQNPFVSLRSHISVP